jgi:hypothetical protein
MTGRVLLKAIIMKYVTSILNGFIWLKTASSGGNLRTQY